MMPPALWACFNDIGGIFVSGALQFDDVASIGDALSVLWQTVAEDVCH
jgi:hypothetical protein